MTTSPLQRLLREKRRQLLDEWLAGQASRTERQGAHGQEIPNLGALRLSLFEALLAILESPRETPFALDPEGPLAQASRLFVAEQARRGAGPTETVGAVLALKRLLTKHLIGSPDAATRETLSDLSWLEQVFEQLELLTVGALVDTRERLITQQSLSLIELSTPVLRLWHRILLLPLIGVIDTVRARQVTERLLEAIARHEARVTILDLTGVPVLDTSVAQHLMKTIDAARLLGTRIVMTGISPEGAQTLTKLGIRFADVISRATLRAGIAEALLLVDQRIAPLEERRP